PAQDGGALPADFARLEEVGEVDVAGNEGHGPRAGADLRTLRVLDAGVRGAEEGSRQDAGVQGHRSRQAPARARDKADAAIPSQFQTGDARMKRVATIILNRNPPDVANRLYEHLQRHD